MEDEVILSRCFICGWFGCKENHIVDEKTMNFIKKSREIHKWKYDYEKVKYTRSKDKVIIVCSEHGDFEQTPNHHTRGHGCKICAGQDPQTAENNFINRIKELGGQVIGKYKGNDKPVECICKENHKCKPTPASIRQGCGMCKICAGQDPQTAENNFINKIKELGGQVIGKYKRANKPVECICKENHKCKPRPNDIKQGKGMCSKCISCPACGLYRTLGKLCEYCKPPSENKLFAKTKEMDVVRYLREKLPEEEFIHNKSVGKECTGGHLYPDIRFERIFYDLIVEIDENKHSGSGYKCDEQRMYDIIAKLGKPCIFLRYNPDAKDSCKEELFKKVEKYLQIDEEDECFPWNDYGFCVEYLFY